MVTPLRKMEPDMLERIVREVTQRLRETPQFASILENSTKTTKVTPENATETTPAAVPKSGVVKLAAQVVTLAEIAGRLEGARELAIGPRAILTPAVKDRLIQQRITVTRTVQKPHSSTGQPRLLVAGFAIAGHEPSLYWQQLERLVGRIRRITGTHLMDILPEMATQIAEGDSQALLLTDQRAAALCLANRQSGVRAISATDVDAVLRDTQSLGANLLVVSPRGRTAYQVGNLAKAFCQGGVLPCPERYREWLS